MRNNNIIFRDILSRIRSILGIEKKVNRKLDSNHLILM